MPKDYTDDSEKPPKISLNLVRYAAVDSQGKIDDKANSIIMNPGGPGVSGVDFVLKNGKTYARWEWCQRL